MRTADAVIVGGGVTGCSLAFQLAGAGVKRVLVLERRFLGAGGTGRSVGIIRQLYPTPQTTQMVLRSLAVFQRFGDAVGGASGFVSCGVLIGVSAAMRPALERTLALQRGLGLVEARFGPEELGIHRVLRLVVSERTRQREAARLGLHIAAAVEVEVDHVGTAEAAVALENEDRVPADNDRQLDPCEVRECRGPQPGRVHDDGSGNLLA